MAKKMMMGDGNKYVLNTPEPSLAEIHDGYFSSLTNALSDRNRYLDV